MPKPRVAARQAAHLEAPHDDQTERSLLGVLMMYPEAWPKVEALTPQDFFRERHQLIFGAMRQLYGQGKPPDYTMLAHHLAQLNLLDRVGGDSYLLELFNGPGIWGMEGYYADTLVKLWQQRQAQEIFQEGHQASYRLDGDCNLPSYAQRLLEVDARLSRQAEPEVQSATELLAKEFPPLRWVVDTLVATGTFVALGGKPKLGKGYFGLQMAYCVSEGLPFLGRKTLPVPVLYCALEDGERRIQTRLKRLNISKADGVHFIYKMPPLDSSEGLASLEHYLRSGKYVLVIIDTLSGSKSGHLDENTAQDMAPLMNRIRELAQELDIGIWGHFHHNKLTSGDALMDLRGSSAIGGAVDAIIGLYRDKAKGSYVLSASGRDVPEIDLRLTWDVGLTFAWNCEGAVDPLEATDAEAGALDMLALLGEASAEDLGKELGMTRQGALQLLTSLHAKGKVDRNTFAGAWNKKGRKPVLYSVIGGGVGI